MRNVVSVQPRHGRRKLLKEVAARGQGHADLHRVLVEGHDEAEVARGEDQVVKVDDRRVPWLLSRNRAEALRNRKTTVGQPSVIRTDLARLASPHARTLYSRISDSERWRADLPSSRSTILTALMTFPPLGALYVTFQTEAQLPLPTLYSKEYAAWSCRRVTGSAMQV